MTGNEAKSPQAAATVDVVIVGAGFAGLTAARALRRAGRTVAVLEADDRVGGRTKPATLDGETIDIGGQWVGPTQTHLLALAADYGVRAVPQYADGDNIIDIAGQRVRYQGEVPMLAPADLQEFAVAVATLEAAAAQVPVPNPWRAPEAAAWDAQTVESWLRANVPGEPARELFRALIRAVMSSEAADVSLLGLLAYMAAAGGLGTLIGTRGGAQDSLFEGSVWQIAARIADELGDAVVLGAPVTRIAQDEAGVTVASDRGLWRARRVIVTAPPALAARIAYSPPLPAQRDGLTQRMPMGSVIKVALAYERPFWREQGLSGLVISDRTEFGPWFDRCTPLTRGGALVGFFDGAPARRWADRPAAERRARVLDDLALYFGEEARRPVDYVEEVWTLAPHSRGGYVSVPVPGALTGFGPALREPVGRIHWAGTETADAWIGYIDGAIRSGERAAGEVGAGL
ncbi:MAG TPA: FAD-dependent oxidoreductase [Sphingopyxis sp.]|nr:FAD-dependent oxidoreductase [Sphingopyxis sp.]HMP43560.1 FAD-dependent oxidoreductase [Sphingopyxis sp.]HMQ17640.1 FAD-dependent oxidoreductase [Sphingopyxis sp.]